MSAGSGLADWVAAIGQVAGAVGSFAAVLVAFWIGRRDGRRARLEMRDRDAAQARLLDHRVVHEDGGSWVRATNYSESPFFEVTVLSVCCGDASMGVVPGEGAPAVIDVLAPGRTVDRHLGGAAGEASCQVVARYLDAKGLAWRRSGTAPPERQVD